MSEKEMAFSAKDLETIVLDIAAVLVDAGGAVDDVMKDPKVQATIADIKKLLADLKGEM